MNTAVDVNRFEFSNERLSAAIRRCLRRDTNDYEATEFKDTELDAFTAYLGQDGRVRFSYRPRIKGRGRPTIKCGRFNPDKDPATGKAVWGVADARAMAEREAHKLSTEINPAMIDRARNVPTLDAWLDTYTTDRLAGLVEVKGKDDEEKRILPLDWTKYLGDMRRIYAAMMLLPLNLLTKRQMFECENAYLDLRALARHGKRPTSAIRPARAYLKGILNYGIKCGWVSPTEFMDVKVPTSDDRDRFLLPGEWQAICKALDAMPDHMGLFIRFLVYLGIRCTMAARLKWTDIRTVRIDDGKTVREVLIWTCKGGPGTGMKHTEIIDIPIVGAALTIYEKMAELRKASREGQPTVFPEWMSKRWITGAAMQSKRKHGKKIGTGWRHKVYELSGTCNWHNHDCRRTHGSLKGALSMGAKMVGTALGHAHADQGDTITEKVYMQAGEDMAALIESHLRLHTLLDDIEHGRLTPDVRRIVSNLSCSSKITQMRDEFGIHERFLQVTPAPDAPQKPQLRLVS